MTYKLYDELGISKNASVEDIKKAYRRSAMQHHPDKGGDEKKFKAISNAYEILSDEGKRNQYDQLGDENFQNAMNGGGGGGGGGFQGGMNAHDIFAQMFGGMGGGMHFDMGGGGFPGFPGFGGGPPPRQKKRQDHSHGIRISLQDAYNGIHKTIQINLQKMCMSCKETCPACQGRGQITNMVRAGPFTQVIQQPCGACQSTGTISKANQSCSECKGSMNYVEEKRLEIDILPGVTNGKQIKIDGAGEQRQSPDEIAGDLLLHIQITEDSQFVRDGNNLNYASKLTFKESIIGKTFTIDHFSGPIEIKTIDFGIIQVGKKYEIHGKGMPIEGSKTRFGNLYIHFDIIYPSKPLDAVTVGVLEAALNAISL
jgi:DnaJ family protein A protein 2